MRLLREVLRIYSYTFETVLCAGGLAVSVFVLRSRNVSLSLSWLPWTGPEQLRWILGLSMAGLVAVALAVSGITRWLLVLFSAAAVSILAKGLFLNTQYAFSGGGDVRNAVLVILGAVLAFLGAWFAPKRRARY